MANKFKKGFVREFNENKKHEFEENKIRQKHPIPLNSCLKCF